MRDRLIVHPGTTGTSSLADDLAVASQLGLVRASTDVRKVAAAGGAPAAAALLRHAGLAMQVVSPAVGLDLSDTSTWAGARAGLVDAAEIAVHLGADRLVLAGGAARGLLWEQAVDAFEHALEPALAQCTRMGVRPLLEPVRVQFAFAGFVHTLRDGVALARRVGHGLGLAVDVTHCWWEPDLAALLAAHVDLVGTAHLADLRLDGPVTSRVVPGDGHLPLAAFLHALERAGYDGPYELELIGPAIDAEGAAAALARAVEHVCRLADRLPGSRTS